MSRPLLTAAAALEETAAAVHELIRQSPYRRAIEPPELAEACYSYLERGGKFLRAALLVWSCRLLGGPEQAAGQAAAAVEVFHAWTLVHDDIIDRDDRRRGGATVHAAAEQQAAAVGLPPAEAAHYGMTVGILAGDLQHGWVVDLLASLPAGSPWPELLRRLQGDTLRRVLGGELLDVAHSYRPLAEISQEDMLQVIEWKTAELFAFCGWAGATLAAAEPAQRQRLERFGRELGIAFQLRDDVLGLTGDPERLGKPVGGDLKEGKRTLPVVLAWRKGDEEQRAAITRALGQPADDDARQAATRTIIELGGVDEAQCLADEHLAAALAQLDELPDTPARGLLASLAHMLVERNR